MQIVVVSWVVSLETFSFLLLFWLGVGQSVLSVVLSLILALLPNVSAPASQNTAPVFPALKLFPWLPFWYCMPIIP